MIKFIESGDPALTAASEALAFADQKDLDLSGCIYPISETTFRASHRPPKIVCTGES